MVMYTAFPSTDKVRAFIEAVRVLDHDVRSGLFSWAKSPESTPCR
jgi:hypothetical protein